MLACHVDLDDLDRWLRVGWERARGASVPYPDSGDQPSHWSAIRVSVVATKPASGVQDSPSYGDFN
jgi:hypothetical protein